MPLPQKAERENLILTHMHKGWISNLCVMNVSAPLLINLPTTGSSVLYKCVWQALGVAGISGWVRTYTNLGERPLKCRGRRQQHTTLGTSAYL